MWLEILDEHAVRQGKFRRILEGRAKAIIAHLSKLWLYPHAMYHTKDHWMHEIETFIEDFPELKSGDLPSKGVVFDSLWKRNSSSVDGIVKSTVRAYMNKPKRQRLVPFDAYKSEIGSLKRKLENYFDEFSTIISEADTHNVDPEDIDRIMLDNGFINEEEFDKRNS